MRSKLLFNDKLEVFENGKIMRVTKNGKVEATISKVNETNKYLRTTIRINKETNYLYVHRLVAMAFIPNPNKLPCVTHIDGNVENNHVTNLRWISYRLEGSSDKPSK